MAFDRLPFGVMGNDIKLGMLVVLVRGGVAGLGMDGDLVTGLTCTSLGGFVSPGRKRGSLSGVGILDFLVTIFPLASKPMSFVLSLHVVPKSRGSSGRESSKELHGLRLVDWLLAAGGLGLGLVALGGLNSRVLSDMGDGGLNGLFNLLIHFRVFFGADAPRMGISPIGGPDGRLSPLTTRNCT